MIENFSDAPALVDDAIAKGSAEVEANRSLIITDKIDAGGHQMNEAWLRARVRGWMEIENQGAAYWLGTYTIEGKWIYCSAHGDQYVPKEYRQLYARKVCEHLNKHSSFGGAWLTGWTRGGREFYMLWKDKDGDIQIPIECDKPFIALQKWAPEDWERHACTAWATWKAWQDDIEHGKGQRVKLAQGEKPTRGHLTTGLKVSGQA